MAKKYIAPVQLQNELEIAINRCYSEHSHVNHSITFKDEHKATVTFYFEKVSLDAIFEKNQSGWYSSKDWKD